MESTWGTSSHLAQGETSKSDSVLCWQDCGGNNLVYYWWQNGTTPIQRNWTISIKIIYAMTLSPSCPLLGIYPKVTLAKIWNSMCSNLTDLAIFFIANDWKQQKYPSARGWWGKIYGTSMMMYCKEEKLYTVDRARADSDAHKRVPGDPDMGRLTYGP